MKYTITDWATNYLQFNGKFNFSAYGQNKGVPMEFNSFYEACEYLDLNFDDETREDLYIKEIKK